MRYFLILFTLVNFFACSPDKPIHDQAQEYTILKVIKYHFGDRKRFQIFTYSKGKTVDERAHTIIKAALDFKKEEDYNVVSVHNEAVKEPEVVDYNNCSLDYSPDGKGWSGELLNSVWSQFECSSDVNSDLDLEITMSYLNLKRKLREKAKTKLKTNYLPTNTLIQTEEKAALVVGKKYKLKRYEGDGGFLLPNKQLLGTAMLYSKKSYEPKFD